MAQLILKVDADIAPAQQKLTQFQQAISQILQKFRSIPVNGDLTAQMNAYAKAINATVRGLEKIPTAEAKREQALARARKATADAATAESKLAAQRSKEQKAATDAATAESRLEAQKNKTAITSARLSQELDRNAEAARKNANALRGSTVASDEYRHSVVDLARSFLEYQIAASLIMKPIYKIREAFESLNETLVKTEDAMIELKRVLGEDAPNSEIMANKLFDIAIKYGQEVENVWQISQNFAKSGLSWADTLKATEASILALNVAELDSEEASQGLIAVMSQFGYKATDLTNIIDILNKTADNAPVTTQKLLLALQKTGSYAKAANLDLKETVAIVTALSGATGVSGQQLGTAVKSLLAYTTKSRSLDVYSGLSQEMANIVAEYRKGAASILDVWERLSMEMKHLSKEQGDALAEYAESAEGQSLEQELGEELGEIYDSMTGVYDTAGTYRKNYFIALMQNFDSVRNALGELDEFEGYSLRENEEYMKSYTAASRELTAQWEKLANTEQGWLSLKKSFIEMGKGMLTLLEYSGGLRTALLAIGTIVTALFGHKIIGMIASSARSMKELLNVSHSLTAATEAQAAATEANTIAEQKRSIYMHELSSGFATQELLEELHTEVVEADTIAQEKNAIAMKARASALASIASWVGIAITAISIGIGVLQGIERSREEARRAAMDAWDTDREAATALANLYNESKNAESGTEDFSRAIDKLSQNLGKSKGLVEENTGAYDEYVKKIKEATKAKLEEYRLKSVVSRNAAMEETKGFFGSDYGLFGGYSSPGMWNTSSLPVDVRVDLEKKGYISRAGGLLGAAVPIVTAVNGGYPLTTVNGENAFQLYGYAKSVVDYLSSNGLEENKAFLGAYEIYTEAKNKVFNYLKYAAEAEAYDALLKGEEFNPQKVLDSTGYIWGHPEELLDVINNAANAILLGKSEEGYTGTGIAEAQTSQILQLLRDIRSNTDQLADIEKKRAEAEQAEKEMTTRVYNADTGRFEPAAVTKNVEKANDALNSALEKAAYEEIQNRLGDEKKPATFGEIYEIVQKYAAMGVDASPQWAKELLLQAATVMPESAKKYAESTIASNFGHGIGGDIIGAAIANAIAGAGSDNRAYSINGVTYTPDSVVAGLIERLFGAVANVGE